jgi:hypothetical protein
LRNAIQEHLDGLGSSAGTPSEVRNDIIKFVKSNPELEWACSPPTKLDWYIFNYWLPVAVIIAILAVLVLSFWLQPEVTGLVVVVLAAMLGGFVGVLARLVYVQEQRDPVDNVQNDIETVDNLAQREDQIVQNQLTHLVDIKPQWFRPIVLWLVLRFINLSARYLQIHGALGGIPTIHFARWVIIPGRRLLFFSNYDGSWVNYLGDFIDKAAQGLTAIWSNTIGCPRAEGFFHGGATDEQRFKSWTRDHQIFTDVWYSAYPDLTVDNINNNSFIRIGLAGNLSPEETQEWLARL